MRKRVLFLLLFSVTAMSSQTAESLELTDTGIGPLNFSQQTGTLKERLQKAFPGSTVSVEKQSGDSPDFYLNSLRDNTGAHLFDIQSFSGSTIDLLEVTSSKIKDKYGVKQGTSYREISKLRKGSLQLVGLHHDVALGEGKIWYVFDCNPDGEPNCTKESLQKENKKVKTIRWPNSGW